MDAGYHELKALRSILDCHVSGLNVPLSLIVDYMGYRLIASSTLPISGQDTLVYGSCDQVRACACRVLCAACVLAPVRVCRVLCACLCVRACEIYETCAHTMTLLARFCGKSNIVSFKQLCFPLLPPLGV